MSEGQVMGLTGNSGNSTGPHSTSRSWTPRRPSGPTASPYAFGSFVLDGRLPPLETIIEAATRGESLLVSGGIVGRHRNELPLGRDVVTLP